MSELLTKDAMAKAVIAQVVMCPDEIEPRDFRFTDGFVCKNLLFKRNVLFGFCLNWEVETKDAKPTGLPPKYNRQLKAIWKKAKYKKEHEKQIELNKQYLRAIGYDNV